MLALIRKLHALTGKEAPVDLTPILEAEDIQVEPYPFEGRLQEMICQRVVLIRTDLYEDPVQRRYLTAHALGHHFLHQGSFLDLSTPYQWWAARKKEREADRFAARLLCPGRMPRETSEASEHFGVPPTLLMELEH